jgi:hypothetical protein
MLRTVFAFFCIAFLLTLMSIWSKTWMWPHAKGAYNNGTALAEADLWMIEYHISLWGDINCTLCPTTPVVGSTPATDYQTCRDRLSRAEKDFETAGIMLICGAVSLVVCMAAMTKLGHFFCFYRQNKKAKSNKWRRKKWYRRFVPASAAVAFVFFMVAVILVATNSKKDYGCGRPVCHQEACDYGTPFWLTMGVTVIAFVGAVILEIMWWTRFRPRSFQRMWEPYEQEEIAHRQAMESREWAEYSENLAKISVGLSKMVEVETLRRDNDTLEQQVQFLSQFRPDGLGMPANLMLTQHSKDARLDSRRDSETQSQSGREQDVASWHDGTASHPLSEKGEEVPPPPGLPPTGNVAGGTIPRPPSPVNEKLLKEKNALEKKLTNMESKWKQEAIQRKKLFNELQDVKGKIRVMCRSRPFRQEVEDGKIELEFVDDYTMQVPCKQKEYMFDYCFPPTSTQDSVWAEAKGMAQSALDGYNVCIFAYGQTGSGKTFTMQGEEGNDGITPRMAHEVFKVCSKVKDTHTVTVSCYMVELYLEDVNDLLLSTTNKKDAPKLEIKQDASGIVVVKGVTIKAAADPDDLMRHYRKGCKHRHTRSHAMNDASSRSHLIFSILIETTNNHSGKVTLGKLSLVDLAGSERLKKTKIDATGVEEATAINDSLFELGKAISDLSQDPPPQFVNMRNSKLTLIMSDSLGGNAKTLMIVCVSPATFNVTETINSLEFAMRCKKITNAAVKNEDEKKVAKLKQEHKAEVLRLEERVRSLEQELNGLR